MKILLNEEIGKVRLIMRRELVFKVCCNHYLDENMEFKPLLKSEKALSWYAQDYSEADLKAECFALKFKSVKSVSIFFFFFSMISVKYFQLLNIKHLNDYNNNEYINVKFL